MGAAPDDAAGRAALRRCVLAASVLDQIDVRPADWGVVLLGVPEVAVTWDEVATAIGPTDPESDHARRRLTRWLQIRHRLAELTDPATLARPVGLPVDHVLHPGPSWVQQRVLGGCLDVGAGFVGLLDDPDEVVVVPTELLGAAGVRPMDWWADCLTYLERMGRTAASRHGDDPSGPLRPIGDCDVVTLLASSAFRTALAGSDPTGLRTAAVPMRRRGWVGLGSIDPAFAAAAAAATDDEERGFSRPVLVTVDEVVLASAGGRPATLVLRDPVPTTRDGQRGW